MTEILKECIDCRTRISEEWWKCCPTHTPERTKDVVCVDCMKRLHPAQIERLSQKIQTIEYLDSDGLPRTGQVTDVVNEPVWLRSDVANFAKNNLIVGFLGGFSIGFIVRTAIYIIF
jgi:hypothetical protein